MRGAKWGLALVGAMLASPAMAQQTVQQQFDAASSALAEGKWQEALTLFEALETKLPARPTTSLGLVRVRKGEALVELQRVEEAKAAIESGLAALPASDPSLREDRLLATLMLAGIAERELDYAQAIKHYRAVDDGVAAGDLKLRALVGLTRTGMFSDPATALADADRMMALVHAQPGITAARIAPFQALKGRVLLNLKRYKDAQQELKSATKALGGLTLKVDMNDLSARSDMSLALLLGGEGNSAREYLAYTGAGRISDDFAVAAEMEPPPCGGESNLSPTDVAVVEFSIRDDGSVGYAAPIYWSRTGLGVLAYAKAARGWSWHPENVKKVPPLLRTLTRVELRCSTASARPSPVETLGGAVESWLSSKNVALVPEDDRSDAIVARSLTEELARREREHGTASAHIVPVLSALADNAIATDEERLRHLDRAIAIVRQASGPAPVVAHFEMRRAIAKAAKDGWPRQPKFDAVLEDPAVRSDPRTQSPPSGFSRRSGSALGGAAGKQ
jgi:tetratricopeptide (TPR) repeat protein